MHSEGKNINEEAGEEKNADRRKNISEEFVEEKNADRRKKYK